MTTAVSRILLSSRCAYMGRDGVSTRSVMGFSLVNKCFIHSAGNVLVDKRVPSPDSVVYAVTKSGLKNGFYVSDVGICCRHCESVNISEVRR